MSLEMEDCYEDLTPVKCFGKWQFKKTEYNLIRVRR